MRVGHPTWPVSLYKEGFGHIDKEASRENHMKMKVEVRVMGLQAKEC